MKKIFQSLLDKVPTILTVLATSGVVGTICLSIKATPKALKLKEEAEAKTKKDILKVTWKCYVPAVAVGAGTIACVIGAHILDKKKQASLASAYALLNSYFKRYSKNVISEYGEEAHEKILKDISVEPAEDVDILSYDWVSSRPMSFDPNDEEEVLFYDMLSKRYFRSRPSAVLLAEHYLNRAFVLGGEPCLNDFYDYLGISRIDGGDVIGWDMSDGYYWIDFKHTKNALDDGLEYYIIDTPFTPQVLESYCSN